MRREKGGKIYRAIMSSPSISSLSPTSLAFSSALDRSSSTTLALRQAISSTAWQLGSAPAWHQPSSRLWSVAPASICPRPTWTTTTMGRRPRTGLWCSPVSPQKATSSIVVVDPDVSEQLHLMLHLFCR